MQTVWVCPLFVVPSWMLNRNCSHGGSYDPLADLEGGGGRLKPPLIGKFLPKMSFLLFLGLYFPFWTECRKKLVLRDCTPFKISSSAYGGFLDPYKRGLLSWRNIRNIFMMVHRVPCNKRTLPYRNERLLKLKRKMTSHNKLCWRQNISKLCKLITLALVTINRHVE